MTRARLLALASVAFAAAALAAPPAAHADSVSVLGVENVDSPADEAARLTEALRQRLSGTGGVKMIPGKDYVEMKLVFGCMDEAAIDCMVEAGKSLGADRLIYGALKGQKGRSGKYTLTLRLLNVAGKSVEKFIPSESVTSDDLAPGNVQALAGRLIGQLVGGGGAGGPPTSLTIMTEPGGADVTVDDQPRGRTPVTITDLAPGAHKVAVTKDGFTTKTDTANLRAGEAAKIELSLETLPPGAQQPQPTPAQPESADEHPGRTLKIIGVVGIVVALAAVGVELYTFTHYQGLENDAQKSLMDAQAADPAYARLNAGWFRKPNCTLPAMGGPKQLDTYKSQCDEGTSYAGMSTGLLVGAGVVGAAGIAALVAGVMKSRSASEKPAHTSLAPRLRLISPVIGTSGGGINASFEF